MVDTILTWEELLEEEGAPANPAPAVASSIEDKPAAQIAPGLAGIPSGLEIPAEIKKLFAEREELENRMKVLSGQAPPAKEDAYTKAKFPVKVHTKESRIEERRQGVRDEQRRALTKKRLEEGVVVKQREIERLREEHARREEARHRLAEEQTLRLKRQREEEWARVEEARRLKEIEIQQAKRAQEEELARADEARRLKEFELQKVKRALAEEAARSEEQRRLKETELVRARRSHEEEIAEREQARRLKELELQKAKRAQEAELARAEEQRRLKELELARGRARRAQEMAWTQAAFEPSRGEKNRFELQQWEEARNKMTERLVERRLNERREERRRRAE